MNGWDNGGTGSASSVHLNGAEVHVGGAKGASNDGEIRFYAGNPANGSGDEAVFDDPQTINAGESIQLEIDNFRSQPTGGPQYDIDNRTFTVTLSDGTSFDVTTEDCP